MNKEILTPAVQNYILKHLQEDVNKIALAKPAFDNITSSELAGQVLAKKKSAQKLPTWFNTINIYFPALISIEQCSSEPTAAYKANLAKGVSLVDLTAGFGVGSYFFSKKKASVTSCEINPELSKISAHNANVLDARNVNCLNRDGIEFLKKTAQKFDTAYIDPARRNNSGKVFKLQDCTPDVTQHIDLFLAKADRIIIKTAPLLDLTAGLADLKNVAEIHIVSVKSECKELLWIIDKDYAGLPRVVCATINDRLKTLNIPTEQTHANATLAAEITEGYLYEPDVALLKSGAFNWIGENFNLKKLHQQSHLYVSETVDFEFLGRIFKINDVLSLSELKKDLALIGNVIVRNYPETAQNLVKKYKIKPSHDEFIIFTLTMQGYKAIKATIIQHY